MWDALDLYRQMVCKPLFTCIVGLSCEPILDLQLCLALHGEAEKDLTNQPTKYTIGYGVASVSTTIVPRQQVKEEPELKERGSKATTLWQDKELGTHVKAKLTTNFLVTNLQKTEILHINHQSHFHP